MLSQKLRIASANYALWHQINLSDGASISWQGMQLTAHCLKQTTYTEKWRIILSPLGFEFTINVYLDAQMIGVDAPVGELANMECFVWETFQQFARALH